MTTNTEQRNGEQTETDRPNPPHVTDIEYDRVTKLYLRCPGCHQLHELWPKDCLSLDGIVENELLRRVQECYLSHEWTPDTLDEAYDHPEGPYE